MISPSRVDEPWLQSKAYRTEREVKLGGRPDSDGLIRLVALEKEQLVPIANNRFHGIFWLWVKFDQWCQRTLWPGGLSSSAKLLGLWLCESETGLLSVSASRFRWEMGFLLRRRNKR